MSLSQTFKILLRRVWKRVWVIGESRFSYVPRILLFWNPLIVALICLFVGDFDQFPRRFLISMIIATIVSSFCMSCGEAINLFTNMIRSRLGRPPIEHGPLAGMFVSCLFMPLGLYLAFVIMGVVAPQLGISWERPVFSDYRFGIFLGLLIAGVFMLVESLQRAKVKQAELENINLKAKIAALTAQLNPHLLFNSLNSIASTAADDPKATESMALRLSEFYRSVLKASELQSHSLRKELELCRAYLEIEKLRFGNRIDYSISVSEQIDLEQEVPVLLLQPLVENAVKHGISPKREGGAIRLEVSKASEKIRMEVIDSGVGFRKSSPKEGTGTGLKVCRERLELGYGQGAVFSIRPGLQNGTCVRIEVPESRAAGRKP